MLFDGRALDSERPDTADTTGHYEFLLRAEVHLVVLNQSAFLRMNDFSWRQFSMFLAFLLVFKSLLSIDISLIDSNLLLWSNLFRRRLCIKVTHNVELRLISLYEILLPRLRIENFTIGGTGAIGLWLVLRAIVAMTASASVPLRKRK